MQDGKTVTEQKQLVNKNRQIKQLKRVISTWKVKFEKLTENRKPKYKNTIRRK